MVFTVSCNCLNVKISIRQNPATASFDFIPVTGSGDNSSYLPFKVFAADSCDPGITLEQDYLVHRKQIGEWLVHQCLNCNLDVYVTKPRSSRILICQNVLYDPACIARLRQSSNYSDVFGLVLSEKSSHIPQMPDSTSSGFESLQDEINMVQEQLSNYLQQEENEMESRIKAYEEEQRVKFQLLQEKLRKQKKILINVLLEARSMKGSKLTKSKTSPERLKSKGLHEKSPLSRTKSTPVPRGTSLEEFDQSTEAMFMLDGDDSNNEEPFYPSDSEDSEGETVREPPVSAKKNKLTYSASVPISVPNWCPTSLENAHLDEEDEDGSFPSDHDQIAASMKALAQQSLHNDERYIFGERPRPRLNTGDFTNQ